MKSGANAEIILVRADGALILQQRDDKPDITNPGYVSTFGGHIEAGEEPLQAAVREINEETNLNLQADDLQFYRKCRKTKEVHGEDWDVHYFIATNIVEDGLKVYEGQGYVVISNAQELAKAKTTLLAGQVLNDYFEGFRSFTLNPDLPESEMREMLKTYYDDITSGKRPSSFVEPVLLACTGLVAAGKSTVTLPLAESVGAVRVSSDHIREMLFTAGYNFKQVRPFINLLLDRLIKERFNVFLDFNASTNIPILDKFAADGYRIYVVYANPSESFIKEKILSGNMKHELTFFPKDEFVYESMLTWRHEHIDNMPLLKEKYGVWAEVDTSRQDIQSVIDQLRDKFVVELGLEKAGK